jgi:hypothetical protein
MSDARNLFPCPTADTTTVEATGDERREGARIHDVSVVIPGDRPITAFIVEPLEAPTGQGAGPGLLFAHWFDTEAPNGDRTEFLGEAELLAARGATSLLPQLTFLDGRSDGFQARPVAGHRGSRTPEGLHQRAAVAPRR